MWVIFVRENIVQDDIPVAVLGFTAAGLAQSVERLTAERVSRIRIPGPDQYQNEGTAFSLQTARPSHDSDDHVNLRNLRKRAEIDEK